MLTGIKKFTIFLGYNLTYLYIYINHIYLDHISAKEIYLYNQSLFGLLQASGILSGSSHTENDIYNKQIHNTQYGMRVLEVVKTSGYLLETMVMVIFNFSLLLCYILWIT